MPTTAPFSPLLAPQARPPPETQAPPQPTLLAARRAPIHPRAAPLAWAWRLPVWPPLVSSVPCWSCKRLHDPSTNHAPEPTLSGWLSLETKASSYPNLHFGGNDYSTRGCNFCIEALWINLRTRTCDGGNTCSVTSSKCHELDSNGIWNLKRKHSSYQYLQGRGDVSARKDLSHFPDGLPSIPGRKALQPRPEGQVT